jgi:hypothetical protein
LNIEAGVNAMSIGSDFQSEPSSSEETVVASNDLATADFEMRDPDELAMGDIFAQESAKLQYARFALETDDATVRAMLVALIYNSSKQQIDAAFQAATIGSGIAMGSETGKAAPFSLREFYAFASLADVVEIYVIVGDNGRIQLDSSAKKPFEVHQVRIIELACN